MILDTHIFIWLMMGELPLKTKKIIQNHIKKGKNIFLSVISIWEISMLESKGRINFTMNCLEWIQKAISAPYIQVSNITPKIAVESCHLPGLIHADPADRIIIATARSMNLVLITKDEKILNYSQQNYLKTQSV